MRAGNQVPQNWQRIHSLPHVTDGSYCPIAAQANSGLAVHNHMHLELILVLVKLSDGNWIRVFWMC